MRFGLQSLDLPIEPENFPENKYQYHAYKDS